MTVASKVKQTLANLKGIKSTMQLYFIQTEDKNAKAIYEEAIKKLKPYLLH
ncbi:DUF1657 domain-containing protein [Crassaminicella indica]|uniref:DUF1657 domain-containing protein n=1 Tax=Crassaminicella indica TaxID=2855394 RepID=A0ABX8REM0_9CLOT|nr:DUF1657 domain-containing protein [Crassaminicella indica]QXM05406.1 DUF1657 domain-containing protein [Crassaminicella indica]